MENEALMSTLKKIGARSRYHWIIACYATMDPNEFAWKDSVMESRAKLKLQRKKAPRTELRAPDGGVEVRNSLDHFVVSESRGCDQRVSYVAAQGGEMHG